MADSTSAVAGSPVSGADLARAEKFTFEPFIHEGDDAAVVLAEGTPRRRALDEALAEIERCSGTQFDPQVVHAFLAVSMSRIEAIHANAPFGLRLVRAAAS